MNMRPVIFGEVLFDRFPDGTSVLGGAPFNVAWHLQAFSAKPLFISRVGNDALGRQIKNAMLDWHMDTAGLQLDSAHPTATVEVTFPNDEPAYDIVDNRACDFINSDFFPPLPESTLLYHGTLALRHNISATSLEILRQKLSTLVFIDINLRQPWWTKTQVNACLNHCQWVKLNEHELDQIIDNQDNNRHKLNSLFDRQAITNIVLTAGEKGAIIADRDQNQQSVKPEMSQQVVDTVGAGDAFSSVILLGIIKRWPIKLMLERAQAFASAIVTVRGATINDREFYQAFIRQWDL